MENLKQKLLTVGDGSERQLRPVQAEFLEQFADNYDKTRIHVANLPCGFGKSMISRILQQVIGCHVITPSNLLIDQYVQEYPEVNSLKGKQHYACKTFKKYTCAERKLLFNCQCSDCHYKEARTRASIEPTFFNPMSLYYNLIGGEVADLPLIIVDEAHSLISLLSLVTTRSFAKKDWHWPASATTEIGFAKWLHRTYMEYNGLIQRHKDACSKPQKILKLMEEQMQLKFIYQQFTENTENFLLWVETVEPVKGSPQEILRLSPIKVPDTLVHKLLGKSKILLMSGTMLSEDIKELVGDEPYSYYDIDSPIPVENRQVRFTPMKSVNYETDPKDIFDKMLPILNNNKHNNILIHVTYSMQEKLLPLFANLARPIHFNTSEDKSEIVARFVQQGGIFLAAGCAEGLDFKNDQARINIIPKLDMPNLGDPIVKKRQSLPEGRKWYAQTVLKQTIQRAARTTRNEQDYSETYIFDPQLPKIIKDSGECPKYFRSCIKWTL
jgi:Rad3-related DNA helicase